MKAARSGSFLRLLVMVACSVNGSMAQVEPNVAERDFAAVLKDLPEDQARARLASADPSLITKGLCRALALAVKPAAERHHDLPHAVTVGRLRIDVARMGGFTLEEADGYYDVGTSLNNLGRLSEALQAFSRALDLYQQAAAPPEKIAGLHNNWGTALRRLGNDDAARDEFRLAEELYRRFGNEVGIARVLNNTGLALVDKGDYRNAMQCYQQSLDIAIRRKEIVGQSFVLNNMSGLALMEGNYELAATYATRSVKLKEAAASQEDLASSLTNLGTVYHYTGKDREAEEALRRAIRIADEAGLKPVEAEALAWLGRMESDQKRYREASADLEKGASLHRQIGQQINEASSLGWLARVRLEMGDPAGALEIANRARSLARETGATLELSLPSLVAGRIYRASKRDAEARAALEESIDATEKTRDSMAGPVLPREAFLGDDAAPYREMTALEAYEGHWPEALAMSERCKGRVLLDLLGGHEKSGGSMSGAEARRQTELRGQLASLAIQFRLASEEAPPAGAKMRALRIQMDRAYGELTALRAAFSATHPELSVRRGVVQPAGWQAAANLAGNATIAILDYVVTPAGTYLFVIRHDRTIVAHRLRAMDLSRQIKIFREKLASRDPEFPRWASMLYQTLIAPASRELSGKETLIVAPDGDLWQVPFQALRSPGGHYLIEDAAVFYAPSISVLAALRMSPGTSSVEHVSLGAFGNPTGDWPESETEVTKLAALYGNGSRVWLGTEATEDNFRQHAGAFDVIEVAAHGVFDSAHPQRSRLVFHPPEEKKAEDGWLEADEIRDLEMRAALVVLSGCETGRGSFEEGEGAVGMAWAFLAAGNRAVLASQWRVESESTTAMMARFHTAWRRGAGKAEALREAELDLMRDSRFRHPFYWAGFQLFGDGY